MNFELENTIGELRYVLLYPPEGESSILEVSTEGIGEFLHVSLNSNGVLNFTFFLKELFTLTSKQLNEISKVARDRLELTTYPNN